MVQIITFLSFRTQKIRQLKGFCEQCLKGGRAVIIVMAISQLLGVLCLHYQAVFYLLHKADHMFDTMSGTLAQFYSGTLEHWNSDTLAPWHLELWHSGTVAHTLTCGNSPNQPHLLSSTSVTILTTYHMHRRWKL